MGGMTKLAVVARLRFAPVGMTENERPPEELPPAGLRHGDAALRRHRHLHAPAAVPRPGRRRDRHGRRAVGWRHHQPAGRPPRPAPDARPLDHDAARPPRHAGGALRAGQVRRSRRCAGQSGQPRGFAGADREVLRPAPRRRRRAACRPAATIWSPCPSCAASPPRRQGRPGAARHGAFRRPQRHLGHLFRRLQVHPRHAVPPRRRGGPARSQARGPDRHPRLALQARRQRLGGRAGHAGDHHRGVFRPRRRQGDRRGPPRRRRRPDLCQLRRRRARSRLCAGHRHARDRRLHPARGAAHAARPARARTWSAATWSRSRRPST